MKKKRTPIGIYDNDILCASCDSKLGVYDKYALDFAKTTPTTRHLSDLGWTLPGIDQQKLKLFCISYLWRASITTKTEFRGVTLGAKHEEAMRKMLLAQDPGGPNDYSLIFARFSSSTDPAHAILFPARTRLRKLTFYEGFLPNFYKFWIKIDSQSDPVLASIDVGAGQDMFVHDKGSFDSSIERKVMVKAVQNGRRR